MLIKKKLFILLLTAGLLIRLQGESLRETVEQLNIHLTNADTLAGEARLPAAISLMGPGALALGYGIIPNIALEDTPIHLNSSVFISYGLGTMMWGALYLFLPDANLEYFMKTYDLLPEGDELELGYKLSVGEEKLKELGESAQIIKYITAPLLITSGIGLGIAHYSGATGLTMDMPMTSLVNIIPIGLVNIGVTMMIAASDIDVEYLHYTRWKAGRKSEESRSLSLRSDAVLLPQGPALMLTLRI